MEKDRVKISELAEAMKPAEAKVALLIGKIMSEKHHAFEVRKSPDQMSRHDLDLYWNDRSQERLLLKIEVECGYKQTHWKNFIPTNWYRGFSILDRKMTDPKTNEIRMESDIFIKTNLDCTSLFAMDSQWLVKKAKEGTISKSKQDHNLGFKTNNDFWSVPIEMARQAKGYAAVCENSNFKDLEDLLMLICKRKIG